MSGFRKSKYKICIFQVVDLSLVSISQLGKNLWWWWWWNWCIPSVIALASSRAMQPANWWTVNTWTCLFSKVQKPLLTKNLLPPCLKSTPCTSHLNLLWLFDSFFRRSVVTCTTKIILIFCYFIIKLVKEKEFLMEGWRDLLCILHQSSTATCNLIL